MLEVKDFIVKVKDALETQGSWGKEQMKVLLYKVYTEMLEERIADLEEPYNDT